MAIQIKSAPASAHEQAAEEIVTETTVEQSSTDGSEVPEQPQTHEHTTETVLVPVSHERLDVAMEFKMPVAQYTMLGFSVRRSVPFDPAEKSADDVFAESKAWVEEKLNGLIAEQQSEG